MRQSTKFYAVLLCAALGFSASIQSCKDYDDDIDGLQEQLDAVNKSIDDLKKDFGALAYVKDVKWDESTRTLTITPASGNPVTYKITDADTQDGNTQYTLETKEENGVVTITLKNDKGEVISAPTFTMPDMPAEFDASKLTFNAEDGYIYYNGVKTAVQLPKNEVESFDENKFTITAGEKGKVVIKYGNKELGTINTFDPNALTVGKDGVVLYYGEPTQVSLPQVTIPALTITEVKDAAGTIIGYTIKYGKNEPVNLKLISEKLQSLVFMPDLYYQGIEAMCANTFYYNALKLSEINADNDYSTDEATEGDAFSLTPNLVAKYHMNPSNAATGNLKKENIFFITEDKAYTKAGENKIEIVDFSATNGILTVQAGMNNGLLKDIEKDGEVTVMALQVGTKGEKGDTLITSDYAAVKAMKVKNFKIADARDGIELETHFYTTAAEAIREEPQFNILWNNAKGIDVAELVSTHADRYNSDETNFIHIGLDHSAATDEIKAYGLKYGYELVGYHAGANKTSQSAHAAMQGSILRAQTTLNGKQQTFGAEQNRSTIGRMPLVRVSLIDTAANNVVAVAYVKFRITDKEEVAPADEVKYVANFAFFDDYTVGCTPETYNLPLNWAKVEEGIYTALNMSKEEFEGKFKLELYADKNLEQFTNTTVDAKKVEKRLGVVSRNQEAVGGEMTEVLVWNVLQAEAYNTFAAGKKEASVIVRFAKENANNTKHYVYVTLTWTPKTLNVNPEGEIMNNADTKFEQAWFAEDKGTSGFHEVHFNVEVPNSEAACKFEKDILDVFVGNKVTVSGVDVKTYESFKEADLIKEFVFVTPDETDVKGSDGNSYKLSVSEDGLTLNATLLDDKGHATATSAAVAVLSTVSTNDANNNYVTYQENEIAKAVLNYASHLQLGNNETLTAKVQINVKNQCGQKLNVKNNTFDVKFLRPISINPTKNGTLVDATDNGSKLELNKVMEFVDWRTYKFVPDHQNYFGYYGVESIEINTKDIMFGSKKLNDVYPAAAVNYEKATVDQIGKGNFGSITWHNNGTALSGDITIELPVEVTYKWGTFKVMIPIVVKKTIGQ